MVKATGTKPSPHWTGSEETATGASQKGSEMNFQEQLALVNGQLLEDQKQRGHLRLVENSKHVAEVKFAALGEAHDPIDERNGKFYVGKEPFYTYLEAALFLKQRSIYSCYPGHAKNI